MLVDVTGAVLVELARLIDEGGLAPWEWRVC
jgi:hypothetical protein